MINNLDRVSRKTAMFGLFIEKMLTSQRVQLARVMPCQDNLEAVMDVALAPRR